MVFDPDHFAQKVIELQSQLWNAFINWHGGSTTLGAFLDAATSIKMEYAQCFSDLQEGAERP